MTLFNEYEAMNEAGGDLADAAEGLLGPLIAKVQDHGYPLRQVETILHASVSSMIAARVVRAAMQKRKAKREAYDAHSKPQPTD